MIDTQESTSLLENSDISSRDHRRWTRFKPEEAETYVLVEDERIIAEVVDESVDGIGLLVGLRVDLQVDDQIELLYYEVPVRGVVRSVSQEGRKTRLGLQWSERRRETPEATRPRCRTESEYILVGGIPVACRVIDQKDNTLLVRMPDQTEIEVSPDDVRVINRFQRLADLKPAKDELRVLAAFYQLGALQSTDDILRAVLNFEFAPSWG